VRAAAHQGVASGKPSELRQAFDRHFAGSIAVGGTNDVGGLSLRDWLHLYGLCYTGNGMGVIVRIAWPDGRSLVEQPALAVTVLETAHASQQAEWNRQAQESSNA
jgi:hypothetical protein